MCISFIIHLFLFCFYLILKIWDCFVRKSGKCMYKLFVFTEYTLLIVGYLLVHMHIFVFSSLNFRKAIFNHSYFVFAFLIAICYLLVFAAFWIYSAFKLFKNTNLKPLDYNSLIFFSTGYKSDFNSRTYDLWFVLIHLVIGLMIGFMTNHYVA